MITSIGACLLAFVGLLWILRARGPLYSLGLPAAYLLLLLMNHLPGAIVHAVAPTAFYGSEFIEKGIQLAAIGSVAFVVGVLLSRLQGVTVSEIASPPADFSKFCLVAGWATVFFLAVVIRIPSVSAVIEKGGAAWMLGVMLGLRASLGGSFLKFSIWICLMLVYPVVMLLLGGFLGYGFMSVIICLAPLAIWTRSRVRVAAGTVVAVVAGFHLFLSYYSVRDQIRTAVWGEAEMTTRLQSAALMFDELHWFNFRRAADLEAVDQRLNQNFFVGVAVSRIDNGDVDFLRGRSLIDGVISLVPRILWPGKPVVGGSPGIIMEMTGLQLSETTSWGVGQVMEFYINFGILSLVIGFVLLGLLMGWLDQAASVALASGDTAKLFRCFLPAVALIGPLWSIVELASGAAAAFIASFIWDWAWKRWTNHQPRRTVPAVSLSDSLKP